MNLRIYLPGRSGPRNLDYLYLRHLKISGTVGRFPCIRIPTRKILDEIQVKNKIAPIFSRREVPISQAGGITRLIRKNISIGVRNRMSESICAMEEVGSRMTIKLIMNGITISMVTGVPSACTSSWLEHMAPTDAKRVENSKKPRIKKTIKKMKIVGENETFWMTSGIWLAAKMNPANPISAQNMY